MNSRPPCDRCGDPALIRYANGAIRCAGHCVPFSRLQNFDPETHEAVASLAG